MNNQVIEKYKKQNNNPIGSCAFPPNVLISDPELEIQKGLFQISETDVKITQSQLNSAKIGARPEIDSKNIFINKRVD